MGGRGRITPNDGLTDRWAWIADLSAVRLEKYGHMTKNLIDSGRADESKEALNFELSKYYERKHGIKPDWSR